MIGELDGPVGHALANLIGDQVKGHSRVFAILSSDVQVRPATVMVSKVTVKSGKYTNILMGTVQAAIAHGVLDAVRAGDIPKDKVNDLGIIYSVWLDPSVTEVDDVDHKALFDVHREATAKVIKKAMRNEPTIDWLLENQDKVTALLSRAGGEGGAVKSICGASIWRPSEGRVQRRPRLPRHLSSWIAIISISQSKTVVPSDFLAAASWS